MSCKKALDAASADEARIISSYEIDCKNAIANLIGYKSKGLLNAAKKAYKENKTSVNKRKLAIAQRKYDEHNELFDLLLSDMMLNAKEINYDKGVVSPLQMAEDWRMSFAKRLRGEITPISIMQGTRTIRSTKNLVLRMIAKRNKVLKAGKINKKLIWGAPPEFVAQQVDRFGFMQKLIKKALTLSDRDISITSKFSVPMAEAREKFTLALKSASFSGKMKDVFNFTNSSLWGVSGVDGLPFRLKHTGEDILIVGEAILNNIPHFRITKVDDPKAEEILVPRTDVNATEDEIREAFIGLYRDELTNEIMDGQTRFIIPSVLNREITTIEDESGLHPEEDADYLRAKAKVIKMHKEGKSEGDETGNRVAGVHVKEVRDGARTWRYRYIMVKQGEGAQIQPGEGGRPTNQESYKVYLISKVAVSGGAEISGSGVNYVGRTFKGIFDGEAKWDNESYTQAEVDKVFFGTDNKGVSKKGDSQGIYYRSNTVNDFGRRLAPATGIKYKKGDPIDGTHTKQYVNFEEIENQPNEKLMPMVWDLVGVLRNQMDLVWRDMASKTRKIEKKREILKHKLESKWRKAGKSEKWIRDQKDLLLNIGGVDSRVKWTKDGSIRTANTFAKKKAENYVPQMYTYASIRNQLQTQIEVIQNKISRAKAEGDEGRVADLSLGLSHLSEMMMSLAGDELPTKLLDLSTIPWMKHITAWTNQTKRRKDGNIYDEYLNHAYRNIHRNEIIVEMLETVDNMSKVEMPAGSVEYMANRMKMAFGDADTRAMTPWMTETGYAKTAHNLNRLPKWMRMGVTHDAKSAERLTKWFTTPATMRFLGAAPSLGNQTQIVNQIIQVGWNIYSEAGKSQKQQKEMWERVIQNTGVLNVLTMFSDIMMVDGDPKWNDFAFLPGTSIPNPMKVHELGQMLRLGRESFINSRDDRIDALLIKLEMRAQGKSRQYIREMQDIRELRKEVDEAILRKKAGQLYDFYTLDENQSEEMITKRFKALVGDVTDAKLKRWVTWKLSWWFNNSPGADIFTFTKGEESLRSKTVVMALMYATQKGLLGNITIDDINNGYAEEILMSDAAKKIGRDAVYNTQFGMTPMYLGEGFNGLGRLIFQYKQYPTLQTIYDAQTIRRFRDGNYGTADSVKRLTKAIADAGVRSYKRQIKGERISSYDPADPNIDHEAIAMVRFLFTRVIASVIGSLISVVPFASRIVRGAGGTTAFNMLRSGESPSIGLILRLSIWTSLLAMNDDDDDREGIIGDIGDSLMFLLLPVLLGFLLKEGMEGIEWMNED